MDHRDSDRRENRKRELISQDAAEWFARMQDPRVSLDDRRRFVRWLKESQVHVAEYLAVSGMHKGLRGAHLSAGFADTGSSNIVELFAHTEAMPARRPLAIDWRIAAAVAACVLAVVLFVAVRAAWYERSIETGPGEWKTARLADGSELQLGPNTLLQVNLDATLRSITLVRGESYFKVAKDPGRPFLVEANAFAVKAVGTQFAVARRRSELFVTVAEGLVRVAPRSTAARAAEMPLESSVPLTAEQQLRITGAWPVAPNHIDLRYVLAWRDRRLMFRTGDTLATAVEEFNVRNRMQLQLDPQIAALPVRGSFDASDPLAFAQTIGETSPVAVQALTADTLLIKTR
ncbi:MAG TPA: FecR domain-containing protein [Steroidobacteraceae bacterium]|nr:FecR domain-containing protein [Steroidobacteraceae bacterium]